jgi:YjbE family integral membrane protein
VTLIPLEGLAALDWAAVGKIILADILLGSDNAVLIALACRKLHGRQRRLGVLWGTFGAIALRVLFVFIVVHLLQWMLLRLVGGVLLLWIGIKLLLPEDDGEQEVAAGEHLLAAIKTIILADVVMSLDNVVAIAASAEKAPPEQRLPLIVFGLLVSIPLIVGGSQLVLWLLDRFKFVVWFGAAMLGYIAGEMIVSDPVLLGPDASHAMQMGAALAGAAIVVVFGRVWARKRPDPAAEEPGL